MCLVLGGMAKSCKDTIIELYFIPSWNSNDHGPWTSPSPRNMLGYSHIVKPPLVPQRLWTLIVAPLLAPTLPWSWYAQEAYATQACKGAERPKWGDKKICKTLQHPKFMGFIVSITRQIWKSRAKSLNCDYWNWKPLPYSSQICCRVTNMFAKMLQDWVVTCLLMCLSL